MGAEEGAGRLTHHTTMPRQRPPQKPVVAVISQSVARRYWPGQDALGKRIRVGGDSEPWMTVVGIAAESRFRALRDATPMVYVPYQQTDWNGFFAVGPQATSEQLVPAIRRAI